MMPTTNPRRIALIGVIAAALTAIAVLYPAVRAFGYADFSWAGAAYVCLPLLVLWISGARHYGVVIAGLTAAVITGVAVLAAAALFIFAVGLSLSGSSSSSIALALLWVVPPALIIALGLIALRFIPAGGRADH